MIVWKLNAVLVKSLSRVQLFATPWTVTYQAPPTMGFSRQEYWSGLPFPSPGDLPNPGIEPWSPALQADTLPSEQQGKLCCIKVVSKLGPQKCLVSPSSANAPSLSNSAISVRLLKRK